MFTGKSDGEVLEASLAQAPHDGAANGRPVLVRGSQICGLRQVLDRNIRPLRRNQLQQHLVPGYRGSCEGNSNISGTDIVLIR